MAAALATVAGSPAPLIPPADSLIFGYAANSLSAPAAAAAAAVGFPSDGRAPLPIVVEEAARSSAVADDGSDSTSAVVAAAAGSEWVLLPLALETLPAAFCSEEDDRCGATELMDAALVEAVEFLTESIFQFQGSGSAGGPEADPGGGGGGTAPDSAGILSSIRRVLLSTSVLVGMVGVVAVIGITWSAFWASTSGPALAVSGGSSTAEVDPRATAAAVTALPPLTSSLALPGR